MKKLVTAIALLTALLMLAGCSTISPTATPTPKPNSIAAIKARGELIVATNAEFAPFEYMDGNKIVGFDIDMAQAIADKLGVKLTVNNMDFDAALAAVQTGKADLTIAGMSVKPERQAVMDFSDTYFTSAVVMLVKKNNTTIKTIDDLKGRKLGVQTGTVADTVVASGIEGATVVRMRKDADSIQDLINGKLDAVLLDESPARVFAGQLSDKIKLLDTPLDTEEYAIAANKGNSELLVFVNGVIKDLKDSGKYDQLIIKFNLK